MFKCLNCGHLFDEGEQAVKRDRHGFKDGPAEEYSTCPVCGYTDLEQTVRCRKCGGEYLEEEMHGHICDKCVSDYVNYDTFLQFATSSAKYSDEMDVLEDFIFHMVFDVQPTTRSSYDMKMEFQDLYKRRVDCDKLMGRHEFMDKINDYMRNWSTRDDFAEWMEEQEVKTKCTSTHL